MADANVFDQLAKRWRFNRAEFPVEEFTEPWEVVAECALEILEEPVDCQAAMINGGAIACLAAIVVLGVNAVADQWLRQISLPSAGQGGAEYQAIVGTDAPIIRKWQR